VWALDGRLNAAYRTLHLITSRARTELAELPMPEGTPHYPSWDQVGRYLEAYVEHFGLGERIRLGTGIRRARRLEGGGWEVEAGDGPSERFDAFVVATGHNDEPRWPTPAYPGELAGEQLHAYDYVDAERFRGQRVLVVGMGNSALDIATDLSHVAERTLLSVRHGSWVIPKLLFGSPADQVIRPWVAAHVSWRVRQPLSQLLLRIAVGRPDRHGLPRPARGVFESHPSISDTVLSRINHGEIDPRPGIAELAGDEVRFVDGRSDRVDAIVWCTGYDVSFPYLDPALVQPNAEELPLYKRVFHLDADDLFFVGMMQSTGSALPIVERQSRLLAAHLTGEWAPPGRDAMAADCKRRRARAVARWGPGGRPAMRVDFDVYMNELAVELKRGRRRTRRSGGTPPLRPRVAAERPAERAAT
jgi:hypothetical protein